VGTITIGRHDGTFLTQEPYAGGSLASSILRFGIRERFHGYRRTVGRVNITAFLEIVEQRKSLLLSGI